MQKLVDYCLNPEHPRGKHKARIFASALGLSIVQADVLREALLIAVQTENALSGMVDEYGQRYTIDFEISTSVGQANIRSAWIIRQSEGFPRFVSAYVI